MELSKEELETLIHRESRTNNVASEILIKLKDKGLIVGLKSIANFDSPDALIIGLDTELTLKGP
ncbi:hypothetical protein [Jeotgalibaca porci]|uniref:hypothetical protein n=1 Tax=Jeotgalibaca porci TaxID=1868793 RepID=UPI00359F4CCB